MPSSYRYASIDSVSSLSISSVSTNDSEPDSDCSSRSQHTALTSWSRMGRRRRKLGERGSPSPLQPSSEDEDEGKARLISNGSYLAASSRRRLDGKGHAGAVGGNRRRRSYATTIHYHDSNPVDDERLCEDGAAATDNLPAYEAAAPELSRPLAEPSNSNIFSQYFPSNKDLHISHPSSEDGNHNLTVDVQTDRGSLTLFHLRMHNLRAREFSLRRYCRESGREVCRITRQKRRLPGIEKLESKSESVKEEKQRRGSQMRELASGLGELFAKRRSKSKSEIAVGNGLGDGTSTDPVLHQAAGESFSPKMPAAPRRVDSGYSSASNGRPSPGLQAAASDARAEWMRDPGLEHLKEEPESDKNHMNGLTELEEIGTEDEADCEKEPRQAGSYLPKDTIKLEFSNYTHLDLKRRGTKATVRRYEFEYWGVKYAWKRVPQATGESRRHSFATTGDAHALPCFDASFQLHASGQKEPLAAITPQSLTDRQSILESRLGSWVPPCALQIQNEDVIMARNAGDVCDVIVATGLLALADECIRKRWNETEGILDRIPSLVPGLRNTRRAKLPKFGLGISGPKRLGVAEKAQMQSWENDPESLLGHRRHHSDQLAA